MPTRSPSHVSSRRCTTRTGLASAPSSAASTGSGRDRLPVLTIMCTNRIDAIDPAVRRRAAAILTFSRPDDSAREELLRRSFRGVQLADADIKEVVRLTGAQDGRGYGCRYSDLRQRFVPTAVLGAVDDSAPITGERLIKLARDFVPTRPFDAELTGRA
jgi:AAA+ superfamily predicted ATPase